jgi:hypothetical protein
MLVHSIQAYLQIASTYGLVLFEKSKASAYTSEAEVWTLSGSFKYGNFS